MQKYFVTSGQVGFSVVYEEFEEENNVGHHYVSVADDFLTEEDAQAYADRLNDIESESNRKALAKAGRGHYFKENEEIYFVDMKTLFYGEHFDVYNFKNYEGISQHITREDFEWVD